MCMCLSVCLSVCKKEPRNLYVNTEDRPDITFFDAESGQNLDVDISLARPWCQGILKRSNREDGFAARTREEKKTNIQEKFYQEGRHQSVSH